MKHILVMSEAEIHAMSLTRIPLQNHVTPLYFTYHRLCLTFKLFYNESIEFEMLNCGRKCENFLPFIFVGPPFSPTKGRPVNQVDKPNDL